MTFLEDATDVTAVYSGGTIRIGQVLAQKTGEASMELLYQCITAAGELKAGRASARFSQGPTTGVRMHLDWQWLTGDRATGTSEWVLEASSAKRPSALEDRYKGIVTTTATD